MLSTYLKRSALTSAAVGSALAVAAAATPAAVMVTPHIATMACGAYPSYPAPTVTGTDLALSRNMSQHGERVRAWAQTRGEGDPKGTVTFSVNGASFATVDEAQAASGVLVPLLPAGETYTVRARFRPECTERYDYQPSSDTSNLTVFKAGTSTSSQAGDRRRGGRPVVSGLVDSKTPAEPGGRVKVSISNGAASRTQTVDVDKNSDGTSSFRVEFGRVWKRGEWTVVTRYLGTGNFEGSRDRTEFRVGRR